MTCYVEAVDACAGLISRELELEQVQDFLDGKIAAASKAVVKIGAGRCLFVLNSLELAKKYHDMTANAQPTSPHSAYPNHKREKSIVFIIIRR